MEETNKALLNFPFSYKSVSSDLVTAIIEIKKAAAWANACDNKISRKSAKAIKKACDMFLKKYDSSKFRVCALQGGAGTSLHMNVNEVIASMSKTDALKEVNASQSTNDVVPSALRIVAMRYLVKIINDLNVLSDAFIEKGSDWKKIKKVGRTHLQDAVPTTLGAEFLAYGDIVKRHIKKMANLIPVLSELSLGGTMIGDRLNASKTYRKEVYKKLREMIKINIREAKNAMPLTSSPCDFLEVSNSLTSLMVDLSKIASDIRLLVSGPKVGIGELVLPEMQIGSSFLPNKVNPVIPEVVNQTHFLVAGWNLTIQMATSFGQLELNVMMPVIADNLISSLKLVDEVINVFCDKCIKVVKPNLKRCEELSGFYRNTV